MALPTVNVEIDGKVVARPRVLRVLLCGEKGTITCTQPQLWPGEKLVERPGKISAIIKESAMLDDREQQRVFRDEMVRSVLGAAPAILGKTANPMALDTLSRQLVDAENAKALLRANGHGRKTDSLAEMVRTLLNGSDTKRA